MQAPSGKLSTVSQNIMKRPTFLLAILACGASLLNAADVFDITLSNAKRYTQCRIVYEAGGNTKFTGYDRSGKEVTMEVKTSSILAKREVAPKPTQTDKPAEPEATDTPAETPATDTPTPAEGESATPADGTGAEAPATEGEKSEEPAPAAQPPVTEDEEAAKVKNISLRLRERLAQVDSELASLSAPSRSLKSLCENRKRTLNAKLAEIDRVAIQVAELQTQYNNVTSGAYEFTVINSNDRDKYTRDGQAAYQAMLIDVKEYKNARKVGGLDKFDILRERYQGIPEYKEAYQWYMGTLRDLSKRWNNLLKREETKRSKLNAAKKADMQKRDQQAYDKLEAQFEKNNEQIAQVWYNPDNRNLVMLKAATIKVKDALRRNENGLKDPAIGTVPALITAYWEANDRARQFMINGDYEGAEKILDDDAAYQTILRLNRNLLPDDYKNPMRAQRQALTQEIKKRARERVKLERDLQRTISRLESATSAAEAQINAMLEQIAREKEVDTQASSIEIEEKKPEPPPAPAADGDKNKAKS